MRVLLLSGLGPAFYNEELLENTLFDRSAAPRLSRDYFGGFDLDQLRFSHRNGSRRLLRPLPGRGVTENPLSDALLEREAPHLTTWTLEAILAGAELEFTAVDLSHVWGRLPLSAPNDTDIVLLSTTFIWDRASLASCVAWVGDYLPGLPLVLGGQYSNLKYEPILRQHPIVTCVVRGDGEESLPRLVEALRGGGSLEAIPNLAFRRADRSVATTEIAYVDMDAHPSPALRHAPTALP